MHELNRMVELATRLSLHFPQAGRSPAMLASIAEDWCEDLSDFDLRAVAQGFKLARRECRFFPSTAELIEFCGKAQRELDSYTRPLALPEVADTTPERLSHMASMASMARKFLDRKNTQEAAQ